MATPNNQFRLRLYPSTSYNFIVDWGDGTSDVFSKTTPTYQEATGNSSTWFTQIPSISASWPGITHTYDDAGKYTIKISEITSGGFAGLQYIGIDDNPHDNYYQWHPTNEYNHDAKKVTAVSQWGAIKWNPTKAMTNSFEGCINLKDVVTDGGTSTLSALNNLTRGWFSCTTLSSFGAIDTSNVIYLDYAWSSCLNLKTFPVIDTSKGTFFTGTWSGCGLSAFPALDMNKASTLYNTWENCTSMETFSTTAISACTFLFYTWRSCSKLKEFPLTDTRNVTSCDRVWENCNTLTAFPLIDMSKNTGRLYACWNNCYKLISFSMLDTKSVYDFGYAWNNCYALKEFPALSAHNVTMFNNAWSNCISLTSFPLIDTSKGIDFTNTWKGGGTNPGGFMALKSFPLIDTSKGTNFTGTWQNCISLPSFPLINTLSGTNFNGTWDNCNSLTAFPLINTSNGKNFDAAWRVCSSLTYFPLLTTSKGESFNYTWSDCYSLTSLPLLDFSKGTTFYQTWSICPKLSTNGSFPINLDTSNSTSFGSAFATRPGRDDLIAVLNSRTSLTGVPEFLLNPLNTAKVKDFSNTWRGCTKLLSFPSTINMLGATNVAGAWGNCYSLTEFPNIMLSSVQIFGSRSTTAGFDATSYSIDHGNTVTNGSFAVGLDDAWLNGSGAWAGCYNMTSFPTLCTQNGTSFDLAWYGMKNLKEFPLINTSNGTRFEKTWSHCFSLTSFPLLDFSKATNIMGAFYALTSLKTFPEIITSKCKYFGGAWNNCIKLTNFPLIDTLSATSFYNDGLGQGAWQNCVSLTAFPMINTSNVTNFKYAWKNCYSLSASPFPQLNMSKMKQNSRNPNYFAALYDKDEARQSGEGGEGCFEGVKLQTQSYSAILTSLCATNFNSNVQFHGGLSNFNQAGQNARNYLVTTKGWTIGGSGGLEI